MKALPNGVINVSSWDGWIDEEFKTIGRGISIKILSYESRDRKKFNTLNIYRNGRMELKCSIDEHDIPLYGTKEHINKSLENVRNYVLDSIKNISYQYIGYKHMEILDPKNIGMQAREGNTRIAFLNVISYCDYMPQLNYTDFNDFAEYFRKIDYRFSHEPKGEEQFAWRKALRFFQNNYDIDAP